MSQDDRTDGNEPAPGPAPASASSSSSSSASGARRASVLPTVLKTGLGLALSIAFLAWAARGVDFRKAWGTLSEIDASLYAATMLVYFSTMLVRAFLVSSLLSPHGRVPVLRVALPGLILGYFCNNIFPLKVGEVVRTAIITRETRIPFWTGVSALVIERSMDICSLLVIALLVSFSLPLPMEIKTAIRIFGIVLLVILLGVIAVALARKKGFRGHERLLGLIPPPIGPWAARIMDQASNGIEALTRPLLLARVLAFVVLFWMVAVTGWLLRLRAFGLVDEPAEAALVLLVVGFGISVPTAPAYVGVFQSCIVFALEALGVERDRSFPFAVFLHAIDFAFVAVLGIGVMIGKGLSLGGLWAAARGQDPPPPSSG